MRHVPSLSSAGKNTNLFKAGNGGQFMNLTPQIIGPESNRSSQSTANIVSAHPFLQGMSEHQLRILGDCAMQAHFNTNEMIFGEGEPADRFYLIQKGTVALEAYVRDKGNRLIQTIGAGDVLGWSWLFPPYFWHFTARALVPTDAVFIYTKPLREECETDHDLGYELMKRMAEVIVRRLQATRKQSLGLPWP
jgi:CRP/FNR family transcriptional regulator, cyclic AMP receptor protein